MTPLRGTVICHLEDIERYLERTCTILLQRTGTYQEVKERQEVPGDQYHLEAPYLLIVSTACRRKAIKLDTSQLTTLI